MKNPLTITLAVIFLAVSTACAIGLVAVKKQQRTASIVQVFEDRNKLLEACHAENLFRFDDVKFAQGLGQIDTSNCPEPFRKVWKKYVEAVQGSPDFVEFMSGWMSQNPTKVIERMNTLPAWYAVVNAATDYGVKFR